MATALIEEYYLNLLHAGRCEGNVYYLPEEVGIGKPGQLSRESYVAVNEIITRIGGRWNRKLGGHVFEDDPKPLMMLIFETGEMPPKNPTAFYATPPEVADRLLTDPMLPRIPLFRHPDGRGQVDVLEPSAGTGALLRAIRKHRPDVALDAVEIHPRYREILLRDGWDVAANDFLTFVPDLLYDAVVMNPPFAIEGEGLAYVTHIRHAMDLLRPGGVLLAIVSAGYIFRTDKRVTELREELQSGPKWGQVELANGAFKESGTGVRTVLLGWTKP
jgi:hypothetical protein